MLDSLITSKTRVKLLLKFFLNSENRGYLRSLEQEFGESSNAIRVELNRLEKAGLLESELSGNRKYFQANTSHPLYNNLNSLIKKSIGIDQLVDTIANQISDLEAAYITGDFANGNSSKLIDLVLIGTNLDSSYIGGLISKTEKMISKKVRYLILTADQMTDYFKNKPALLIWKQDKLINK